MDTPQDTPVRFDKRNADSYEDRWAPLRPLRESLHLQMGLILEEAPQDARVLCVGAGTGAELLALAKRFPKWRFVAVDPSEPMLEVCRRLATEQGIADRCEFLVGFAHEVLDTRRDFDVATAILVSQFVVERPERLRFFQELRERLRPGGLLVSSDLSVAPRGRQDELLKVWRRMMAFAGAEAEQIEAMIACYGNGREVSLLDEEAIEALIAEAGFAAPVLFSQTLLIRSWYARARGETP